MKWLCWISLICISVLKELIFNQLTIKQVQNNYWVRYKIEFLFDQLTFISKQQVPVAKTIFLIVFILIGTSLSYLLAKLYQVKYNYLILLGFLITSAAISGSSYFITESTSLKLLANNIIGLLFTPLPIFIAILMKNFMNWNPQQNKG